MSIKHRNRSQSLSPTPFWHNHQLDPAEIVTQQRRIEAVQSAIAGLSPLERELITRVHFDGATVRQVAEETGYDLHFLLNLHRRALRRLRKLLSKFAVNEFKISSQNSRCVICCSPNRSEIEKLLKQHPPGTSYRDVIRQIRSRFNVAIVSVMTIVGHSKYHG